MRRKMGFPVVDKTDALLPEEAPPIFITPAAGLGNAGLCLLARAGRRDARPSRL